MTLDPAPPPSEWSVVVLTGGDRVPADLTLVVAGRCTFDESTLTGESEPVLHEAGAVVFAGTFVAEGESEGVVTATGAHTRLAGIAALTTSVRRPPGPLDLEIQRIVRTLAFGSVGVGTVFFAVSSAGSIVASAGTRSAPTSVVRRSA